MTEKDFNRAILAELAKVAKDYFSKLSIPAGTYTAAELSSGKKEKEEIKMNAPEEIREAKHIVSVGLFRCEFPSERVFDLVYKFEKLSGIGQKDKMHFVRMAEPECVVCSFVADFGKGIRWLENHIRKDGLYPQLGNVCLNLERSELVATDSHIISISNIEISEFSGKKPDFSILLNSEMIKNLKGECYIRVINGGIIAENASGMQYIHKYEFKRYVNYLSVIPKVSNELRADFNKESVKRIMSFLKSSKNNCKELQIDINPRESFAKFIAVNSDKKAVSSIRVGMEGFLDAEIRISFIIENFLRMKNWDGRIWFGCDSHRVALFGDKCAKLIGLMPSIRTDEKRYSYQAKNVINAFDAVCGKNELNKKKVAGTSNLPAEYRASNSIVAGFIESLCSMLSVLYDMTFFITLNDAIRQIRQLSYLSGKDFSELINMKAAPARAVPDKPDEIVRGTASHPCLNYMIRHTERIRPFSRPVIAHVDEYMSARVLTPVAFQIAAIRYPDLLNATHELTCAYVRIVGYFHIRGPTAAPQAQLAYN